MTITVASQIMYRVTDFPPFIKPVQIVKQTEKFVVLSAHWGGERREAKTSEYASWFDSFDEAKEFATNLFLAKIETSQRAVNDAAQKLRTIEAMEQTV